MKNWFLGYIRDRCRCKNNSAFWGESERALTKDDLYPQDDEIEALCKEVSIELFDVLANKRSAEISGDYYLSFMSKWIAIEKLLFEYLGKNNNYKHLTSAGLIKKITNSDLRIRLNRARAQRNFLAHNVDKDISIKELLSKEELEELYLDLQKYFQLHY